MDGPFFSIMPYPSRGLYSLHHVRFAPHQRWLDGSIPDATLQRLRQDAATRPSRIRIMRQDAARYVPTMATCTYHESLWEIKALLPRNESDDGRPILIQAISQAPGLYGVLGAKIDNVYDLEDHLSTLLGSDHARSAS